MYHLLECIKLTSFNSFKMSVYNEQPVECPICFDVIGEKNNITTECGHKFHASCIMTNISHNGFSCPCCRTAMAEEDEDTDYEINSEDDDDDDDDESTILVEENAEEPFSNDALRGLRLLTSLLEGEEPDQNDVISEYYYNEENDENNVVTQPPLDIVIRKLREQGVTYEELVSSLLSEHEEYRDFEFSETLERISNELWGKFKVIISNYKPEDEEQNPPSPAAAAPAPIEEVEVEMSESPVPDFKWDDDDEIEYSNDCRGITLEDLDSLRIDLEIFDYSMVDYSMVDYSAQPKTSICV